jgi:hypothetical protein
MSEVEKYLDARANFLSAKARCGQLADFILRVGHHLQDHPENFGFSGTGQPVPTSVANFIDVNEWPTAARIMDAIGKYHKAMQETLTTYRNIPTNRREGVIGPPWEQR